MRMTGSPRLEMEQREGVLRITIPFGRREKSWMMVAVTCMLCFGAMMALVGEYAARSVTHVWALLAIPFVVLGVMLALYLLSLLAINAMPGTVMEFDGGALSVGSIGSERRRSWPREKIRSLHVSRLPMVPIANIVILIGGEPSVRVGVYRRRDLEAVVVRLRKAMALVVR
jgi:hypothetical protein